jgi:hypothetical protein
VPGDSRGTGASGDRPRLHICLWCGWVHWGSLTLRAGVPAGPFFLCYALGDGGLQPSVIGSQAGIREDRGESNVTVSFTCAACLAHATKEFLGNTPESDDGQFRVSELRYVTC